MEIEKDINIADSSKYDKTVYMILDTSYFIKLTPLDLMNNNKYMTTQYIVNEIRDHNAREFYKMNKDFIEVKAPSKESMRQVSLFSEKSNDLSCFSIADLSVIALAYEMVNVTGKGHLLRKEPKQYNIIERLKKKVDKDLNQADKKDKAEVEGEGEGDDKEIEINEPEPEPEADANEEEGDDDEGWITPENIDTKITSQMEITSTNITDIDTLNQSDTITNVFLHTGDFTVQNVCLKMGIPAIGVNGLKIKRIKNYIFKCTTCTNFIFDTTKKFCTHCGYPYLMKIGYSINSNGEIEIHDKKANVRKRGTQFDLPKPSLGKKRTEYILAEDQIPKKKTANVNIDKILDNYEKMKEMPKMDDFEINKSSKQFVWGYPKQNPNKAKKKYSKK